MASSWRSVRRNTLGAWTRHTRGSSNSTYVLYVVAPLFPSLNGPHSLPPALLPYLPVAHLFFLSISLEALTTSSSLRLGVRVFLILQQ